MKPDLQLYPHHSFIDEVHVTCVLVALCLYCYVLFRVHSWIQYLQVKTKYFSRKMFSCIIDGGAYVMGRLNGRCW